MTVLNQADAIYLGADPVDAVYLGAEKVWPAAPPPPVPATLLASAISAAFINQNQGRTVPINTTGATLLVLSLASWQATTAQNIAIADTYGNQWANTSRYPPPANSTAGIQMFYCIDPATGPNHEVDATGVTLGSPTMVLAAFAGPRFTQIDLATGANQLGPITAPLTPSSDNQLVMTAVSGVSATPTGVTVGPFELIGARAGVSGQFMSVGAAWMAQEAAQPIQPFTWQPSLGTWMASILASFKTA